MAVETGIKKIKKISKKKARENWRFRSFLKGYDIEIEELDSIVHRLYKQVSGEIDCTACANCCREIFKNNVKQKTNQLHKHSIL